MNIRVFSSLLFFVLCSLSTSLKSYTYVDLSRLGYKASKTLGMLHTSQRKIQKRFQPAIDILLAPTSFSQKEQQLFYYITEYSNAHYKYLNYIGDIIDSIRYLHYLKQKVKKSLQKVDSYYASDDATMHRKKEILATLESQYGAIKANVHKTIQLLRQLIKFMQKTEQYALEAFEPPADPTC